VVSGVAGSRSSYSLTGTILTHRPNGTPDGSAEGPHREGRGAAVTGAADDPAVERAE
jgi:hypothetical protein